ncbi:hypothetical protein HOLleu_16688 [Holothuria leucospilota]|uniref:DUF6589 domain-containing protein n=1 Tax=Holothuria leucospilota TaxID=206669 RepID=A0A9Q1C6H7_HOLLE|nr:hypothetical protein HOLleu_16688 [Holothuria leucospilota]
MKNINAAPDLVDTYTKALVIAAAMEYFGMDTPKDEPTQNKFNLEVHQNSNLYIKTLLKEIIEKLVIPHKDEISHDTSQFQCNKCTKCYKTKGGLQRRMRTKHPYQPSAPATSQQDGQANNQNDAVFNYARCAASMCLVGLNFQNARQMGDKERLMRMYKFLLLHFRASGKQKYSFQVLRLLALVQCFLSPRLSYQLKWNRFVNKTGTAHGNIEVNRENEHHNRVFKGQCKALRGKITPKSVQRVSCFAQELNEILNKVDFQLNLKKPNGKHSGPDLIKEASALAAEMKRCNIFHFTPGRQMMSVPTFPSSTLSVLNTTDLYKWMRQTLKALVKQHIFRRHLREKLSLKHSYCKSELNVD